MEEVQAEKLKAVNRDFWKIEKRLFGIARQEAIKI